MRRPWRGNIQINLYKKEALQQERGAKDALVKVVEQRLMSRKKEQIKTVTAGPLKL